MRTSKQQRLDEWLRLDLLASNGRLLTWPDIKRWRQLRVEFGSEQGKQG